jgi:hypothetical protein
LCDNDTLWCVLVIHNLDLDFTFKNIEVLYLLFSFLHCIFFLFSTYFFDNITLCTNLQNVTLSNMSHLVYITLYGETDGVILSRLDCRSYHKLTASYEQLVLCYFSIFCDTQLFGRTLCFKWYVASHQGLLRD